MRNRAYPKRVSETGRLAGSETAETACSATAAFWDVGLVLAVFLGLALTVTAALTAFGIG